MKTKLLLILPLAAVILSQGCKSYTSNVILKADESDINWKSAYEKVVIEHPIRPGDRIQFSIFTNSGESIIDPSGNLKNTITFGDGTTANTDIPTYEVLENGTCHFPLIGNLQVAGLRTSQLDSMLSSHYEKYYNGVYTISKVVNKKLVVFGAGGGKIIPFTPNINLLEVIALYGGLIDKSRGYNIRVVRGDLKNPEIQVVNLRTVSDMKKTIVTLLPDDIIYIEPVRRPGSESIRDNLFVFNIIQVILTTAVLINTLSSR